MPSTPRSSRPTGNSTGEKFGRKTAESRHLRGMSPGRAGGADFLHLSRATEEKNGLFRGPLDFCCASAVFLLWICCTFAVLMLCFCHTSAAPLPGLCSAKSGRMVAEAQQKHSRSTVEAHQKPKGHRQICFNLRSYHSPRPDSTLVPQGTRR